MSPGSRGPSGSWNPMRLSVHLHGPPEALPSRGCRLGSLQGKNGATETRGRHRQLEETGCDPDVIPALWRRWLQSPSSLHDQQRSPSESTGETGISRVWGAAVLALQVTGRSQDTSELGHSPVWGPREVDCLFEPQCPCLNMRTTRKTEGG